MTRIVLPFPPSVNHYWNDQVRFDKKRRKHVVHKFVCKRGKEFRTQVLQQCMLQKAYNLRLDGPLQYKLWLYPPKNYARWDIDNFRKALLDALAHARVYNDDTQLEHDEAWKMPKHPDGGRAIIQIAEYTNPHSAHNQRELELL